MKTSHTSRSSGPMRTRFTLVRWLGVLTIACVLLMVGARATAQTGAPSTPPSTPPAPASSPAAAPATASSGAEPAKVTLKALFLESWDLFTVLLVIGSLAGWTIIIICVIEIRKANISPAETDQIISTMCRSGRWGELRQFVADDDAFASRVVRAAMNAPGDDKDSVREAGEMAASEESARWFRKIEPLNVIGNLGPLLGLAGTVWGMIIAFAALGQSGGQANPATLSLGISKALFHTLLGLLLAVPCLTVFGFYRTLVDRLCTRAMVVASEFVDMLPGDLRSRQGTTGPGAGGGAARQPIPQPRPAPLPPRSN